MTKFALFNRLLGTHAGKAVSEETNLARIGRSMLIEGELSSAEDLVIDGRVEGNINVPENLVTVSERGSVEARIVAGTVIVAGKVRGNILAAEKVGICASGTVEGDITTRRLAIDLGAYFRGCVELTQWSRGQPAAATGSGSDAESSDKSSAPGS